MKYGESRFKKKRQYDVSALTLTHEVLAIFVAEFRIFGVILFPVNTERSLDFNTFQTTKRIVKKEIL